MKNDYRTDVYQRIMNIIALLNESDSGMSVNELAETMDIPKDVILEDLKNIHNTAELDMCISAFEEDENATDEDEDFPALLFAGEKNDVKLYISVWGGDELFSVGLSVFEHMMLSSFLDNRSLEELMPNQNNIYIKKSEKTDNNIHVVISEINEAIRQNRSIEMLEMDSKGKEKGYVELFPLKIVSMFLQSDYYVVGICEGKSCIYNVGDIKEVRRLKGEERVRYGKEKVDSILEEYEYRWGVGPNDGIMDVKLKVFEEANLIKRLKTNLSTRKHGSWEDYEKYSIYTDKVIDYAAFKKWVMSLGKSVIVIEPKCLAEDIVNSAKERLRHYNEILNSTQESSK